MTPQDIRIAVAEECGWTKLHPDSILGKNPKASGDYLEELPNYPFDLNAMREVEETLKPSRVSIDCSIEWQKFISYLNEIVGPDKSLIHASALQRAEAFLRVKGKWKE